MNDLQYFRQLARYAIYVRETVLYNMESQNPNLIQAYSRWKTQKRNSEIKMSLSVFRTHDDATLSSSQISIDFNNHCFFIHLKKVSIKVSLTTPEFTFIDNKTREVLVRYTAAIDDTGSISVTEYCKPTFTGHKTKYVFRHGLRLIKTLPPARVITGLRYI